MHLIMLSHSQPWQKALTLITGPFAIFLFVTAGKKIRLSVKVCNLHAWMGAINKATSTDPMALFYVLCATESRGWTTAQLNHDLLACARFCF